MAVCMAIIGLLLLLEPDLGAFIVIVTVAMGLLFLAGVKVRLFAGLSLTMAVTFLALIWASPWRRERIFAYLDPFDEKNALGKGYQLSHSLIAFGRGRKVALPARGAYRLSARGDRRGARADRRAHHSHPVFLDRAPLRRDRPSGDCA
jgi:cell division protein FtsW